VREVDGEECPVFLSGQLCPELSGNSSARQWLGAVSEVLAAGYYESFRILVYKSNASGQRRFPNSRVGI